MGLRRAAVARGLKAHLLRSLKLGIRRNIIAMSNNSNRSQTK